jgi:hypothetical protein
MKIKKLTYAIIGASVILLSGCAPSDQQTVLANGSAVSSSNMKLKATTPNKVKIYFGNAGVPKHYRVIGHVSADNYSMIATPHSQEAITMELKKQAASIGGTGVINVSTGLDRTTGDVILMK